MNYNIFLTLALKCNPTILEILKAPDTNADPNFKIFKENIHWFLDKKLLINSHKGYIHSHLSSISKNEKFLYTRINLKKKVITCYRVLNQLTQLL